MRLSKTSSDFYDNSIRDYFKVYIISYLEDMNNDTIVILDIFKLLEMICRYVIVYYYKF